MGMTIAFVGSSGHIGYALDPALAGSDFSRFVLAPGSADDNMTGTYNLCVKNGKDVKQYDDWRDILKNEKPDVLVNCTVCAYMAEITVAFFKAGAHVFCEKPLARTLEELDAVETAWRKSGKVLLAMLPFRYEAGFR
ncbi:MAG: Gfo/Idh/MocA family oxidoreductase, partial [Clostridia bacterium]|nr:Gfo/Idh/MocA family oxidoreductase [Clostridia bacterium]